MSISSHTNQAAALWAIQDAARVLTVDREHAQVFLEERTDLRLEVGSGIPRVCSITRSRGAALGDERSSLHLTDPTPDDLVVAARRMSAKEVSVAKRSNQGPAAPVWEFDPSWVDAIEAGTVRHIEAATLGLPSMSWSATIIAFHQSVWVADNEFTVASDVRSGCRLELRMSSDDHPKRVSLFEHVFRGFERAIPSGFGQAAVERTIRLCAARAIAPGEACAVFAAGVGGVVAHELVGHALEGDVICGGRTWIQTELPRPTRRFDIGDDPTRGRASWTVDDEGVRPGHTRLVEDSRVVGRLLDRASARALRMVSNGHGRRSTYRDSVRPRMGCTFVGPGPDDPASILQETKTGIFIRRLTAGHTDPMTGRASFVVTDSDLIVDGRLDVPIAPFVMEVRGVDMWRSIDRIGSDLAFDTCIGSCVRDGQPLAVSVGAPTIRLGVITVKC